MLKTKVMSQTSHLQPEIHDSCGMILIPHVAADDLTCNFPDPLRIAKSKKHNTAV